MKSEAFIMFWIFQKQLKILQDYVTVHVYYIFQYSVKAVPC